MLKFRLVHSHWGKHLDTGLESDHSSIRIVCPFIKRRAAERLLKWGKPDTLQVITRFNLADFSAGVSDTSALRLLLGSGAQIRGVRNLHAKVYLLGAGRVIMTSANLTSAALQKNLEFGFVAEDAGIVGECRQYFDDLWKKAGDDVSAERLACWEGQINDYLARGAPPVAAAALGDDGVDTGTSAEPPALPPWVDEAEQSFVKFFGEGHNRVIRSMPTLEEIERSGSHWACTYPQGRRPRSVQDGAVMFMGRMVKEPNDILVFGRAVGMRHQPGRDDATAQDIARRPWKDRWPHYVRVHHAVFVAGSLENGVSLNELMSALNADAFSATQRNVLAGVGNTDPRRAYRQQAAVELSPQGAAWLNKRLERAFALYGRLEAATLDRLDWPDTPLSG
jgi:hypothetical protein